MKRSTFILFLSLMLSLTQACAQSNAQGLVSVSEFEQVIRTDNIQLIDVRTPEEFQQGNIPNSLNIDIYREDFEHEINSLDKSKPLAIYCKSGGRSASAVELAHKLGFKKIYELDGGYMAWEKSKGLGELTNKFSKEDLDKILQEHPLVIVDFYAPWCAPCMKMMPSLDSLQQTYKGKLQLVKINYDDAKKLARALQVQKTPHLLIYQNGNLMSQLTGFQSREAIETQVKPYLSY
jgi:thioredoxin